MSDSSLILIGMPGSGKSTVGKILADKWKYEFIDVDDFIEDYTGKTVGEILQKKGDDDFLKFESDVTQKIQISSKQIISTTGSNPLDLKAMKFLSQLGKIFWLDVSIDIIKNRLFKMKIDRIVGMKKKSLDYILLLRKKFYKQWADLRIKLENETPEEIAEIIQKNFEL